MDNKKVVTKEGVVKEALMGGLFKIGLPGPENTEELAFAALSGKIRKFKIRILPGDRVRVDFSPHDLTRGRITYRFNK